MRGSGGSEFRDNMRLDKMAHQHAARLPVRQRARDRGAGRPACLHQDAAGACRARHRVHVPRRAAGRGAVVPGLEEALRRRLRHPAVPAASRTAAARCCCARPTRATGPDRHATSSARRTTCRPCGRASRSRARSRRRRRLRRSAARRLRPGPKVKTDAEIDDWIRKHRDHRAPSGLDLRDGHRPGRGGRSAVPRARRRAVCAWSTPRRCRTLSRRTSTPAC